MGILNISEDSFYDGGKYNSIRNIIVQTQKMIKEVLHLLMLVLPAANQVVLL